MTPLGAPSVQRAAAARGGHAGAKTTDAATFALCTFQSAFHNRILLKLSVFNRFEAAAIGKLSIFGPVMAVFEAFAQGFVKQGRGGRDTLV